MYSKRKQAFARDGLILINLFSLSGATKPATLTLITRAAFGDMPLNKQFCRSLSPSLITADLADCMRQLPAATHITDTLQLLSPEHCAAILFLVQHFLDANVVQKTKMGLDNLVLILTPCMFGDRIDPAVAILGAEQTFVRRLLSELPPNAGASLHDALQVSRMSSER
jgi:hypothetical protein